MNGRSTASCSPFESAILFELQMEDDSIYNMSQRTGFSVPPPLPVTCNAEPSELYQVRISWSLDFREASFAQTFAELSRLTFVLPYTVLIFNLFFHLR